MGQFEESNCISLTHYEASNISENLVSIYLSADCAFTGNGGSKVVLALDFKKGGCA